MPKKGYKQTKEHLRKNSDVHKTGKIIRCCQCNKEFYRNNSAIKQHNFCSNKCYLDSSINKETIFKVGHKSTTPKGKNHYRWNLNREEVMKNKRNDGEYKQWVIRIKNRDNWKCRINNKDCSGYCVVHHILPWSEYPELRYELKNGITLCQAHHPKKRAEEKLLIPFFTGLMVSN